MPLGEKDVPVVISLAGVGIILAPWAVLLGIVCISFRSLTSNIEEAHTTESGDTDKQYSRLAPSLQLSTLSPSSGIFLVSLLALEVLFATYWAVLKLYHLLPALAVLGVVSAFAGKTALRGIKV